jgi:hypothetical protein
MDQIERTAAGLLDAAHYDLVLTHGPQGEYTSHLRHAECCRAVVKLWRTGVIKTDRLWMFAYEDGGRTYLPRARPDADRVYELAEEVWQEKLRLITELYGFGTDSWEARSNPKQEAFWCFDSPEAALLRMAELEQQS